MTTGPEKKHVIVGVPFTETEYRALRKHIYLTNSARVSGQVRLRLGLPEEPHRKNSKTISEQDFLNQEP